MNAEAERWAAHYKAVRQRMQVSAIAPPTPEPEPAPEPEAVKFIYVVANLPDGCSMPPRRHSERIIRETAAKHGVRVEDLKNSHRPAPLVAARFECYYRLYNECPHLSMPQIGEMLNRDHTSILHGIRRHAERHSLPMPRHHFLEAAE